MNLSRANLSTTDLSGQDLSGVDLTEANLYKAQLFEANLINSNLTGACIEDWMINSSTNLTNVQCDYIYRKYENDKFIHRFPANHNNNFTPGEFTQIFQKVANAVELIFHNGMDWEMFAYAFNEANIRLQTSTGGELALKKYEVLGNGLVSLTVEVPPNADLERIQAELSEERVTRLRLEGALETTKELLLNMMNKPAQAFFGPVGNIATEVEGNCIHQVDTMTHNPGDITQNVTSSPGSNINAFQGNQNQVTQTQGAQAQPSQEEVIEMLSQIKALIEAAELPGEVKIAANANLQVAQKAAAQEEPKKEIALATLESMAETLEEASKTVEAGKTLWGQVKPILFKVAGFLGAAAGSLLLK